MGRYTQLHRWCTDSDRLFAMFKVSKRGGVAKLENASDLGFQNRRFQDITLRFKKKTILR